MTNLKDKVIDFLGNEVQNGDLVLFADSSKDMMNVPFIRAGIFCDNKLIYAGANDVCSKRIDSKRALELHSFVKVDISKLNPVLKGYYASMKQHIDMVKYVEGKESRDDK